jgi:hypothetical protein
MTIERCALCGTQTAVTDDYKRGYERGVYIAVVELMKDLPGFLYLDENGRPTAFADDVLRHLGFERAATLEAWAIGRMNGGDPTPPPCRSRWYPPHDCQPLIEAS